MASPYTPPTAPVYDRVVGSAGQPVEFRYSVRLPIRALALCAVLGALTLWTGTDFITGNPVRRVLFALLAIAPAYLMLGLIDRRVQLRLDADGLRYRRWGWRLVPWNAIADYDLLRDAPVLAITAHDPIGFAEHLSRRARLLFVRRGPQGPRFHIPLVQLEAPQAIVAGFAHYAARTPAAAVEVRAPLEPDEAHTVVMQLMRHRWPQRCFGCGAAPTRPAVIRGKPKPIGFTFRAGVPACDRCRRPYAALVALTWLLTFTVWLGAAYGGLLWIPEHMHILWVYPWMAGWALLLRFATYPPRRFLSRRFWGVESVALLRGDRVEVRLSSPELAREVAQLNETGAPEP